jgi:hypothetical protein
MAVLHSSIFYVISIHINSFIPPRNNSITPLFVLVWVLHSQPLLHFFTNLVITPKPFQTNDVIWGLQRGGHLREQDVGCNMGEQEQPDRVLWWLSVFSYFCTVVRCRVKVDFSKVLWGQTLLKRFGKVSSVWIYNSELMFWPLGVMSTKSTPLCLPPHQKKQWPWLFPLKEWP